MIGLILKVVGFITIMYFLANILMFLIVLSDVEGFEEYLEHKRRVEKYDELYSRYTDKHDLGQIPDN